MMRPRLYFQVCNFWHFFGSPNFNVSVHAVTGLSSHAAGTLLLKNAPRLRLVVELWATQKFSLRLWKKDDFGEKGLEINILGKNDIYLGSVYFVRKHFSLKSIIYLYNIRHSFIFMTLLIIFLIISHVYDNILFV